MRIPGKFLEHRVILEALRDVPRSTGERYLPGRRVSALVVEKSKLVRDLREGSETKGQEIQSAAQVLLQPEDRVALGSLVTIWPGTQWERRLTAVSDAFALHSIAPSSAQLWLA